MCDFSFITGKLPLFIPSTGIIFRLSKAGNKVKSQVSGKS